jgi:hypothetical protein
MQSGEQQIYDFIAHLILLLDPTIREICRLLNRRIEFDCGIYYSFVIQHLSILHNRDSLLHSDKTITVGWESYLQRAGAVQSDVRIVSQVSLLLIMSEVRAILGADGETQMTQVLVDQIFNYSRQLDRWFAKFSALFQPNAYIGDFPRKRLELHYQFGKLYLGHHVFKKP